MGTVNFVQMADYYTNYFYEKFSNITELLRHKFSSRNNVFSKFSSLQIIFIFNKIQEEFQTQKGNWSIKKYEKFKEKNELHNSTSHFALKHFYNHYSVRKKRCRKFEHFLDKIESRDLIQRDAQLSRNRRNGIKFKQDIDFKMFLSDLKAVKHKYLLTTHGELADLLISNFNINYTKKTLIQYLSDSD